MEAIIETGGKQYPVRPGLVLNVEKLPALEGQEVVLERVLWVRDGDKIAVGTPQVEGARVRALSLGETRGEKVRIFKLRRRKHYKKTKGHRQTYTTLRVEAVEWQNGMPMEVKDGA